LEEMCRSGVILDEGLKPIALLHREHEVILMRLALLENAVRLLRGSKPIASHYGYREAREGLKEQVKFFTKAVRVHFKREAILFAVLAHTLASKGDALEGLDSEHSALTTQAARLREVLIRGEVRPSDIPSDMKEAQIPRLDSQKLQAASKDYIALFRDHIAFEEKLLLPLAEKRLNEAQKRRIWHRMMDV
jgi:hemerythrin-like domain-containing protein